MGKRGSKIRFTDPFHVELRRRVRESRRKKGVSSENVYCSNCKRCCQDKWNFCPECGASLDGEV